MPDTTLKVIIEAEARMAAAQQAVASIGALQAKVLPLQQQITRAWEGQVRAQGQAVQLAQRQQAFFSRFTDSFRSRTGIGGPVTLGGLAASAGDWLGMAAGGALASAAFGVVNSFREVATTGLRLADTLSDMAEQLGIDRTEMSRIGEGAGFAGVPQRVVMRGLWSMGRMRGLALGGDQNAIGLLGAYGITPGMIAGSGSNLALALQVHRALGGAGATPRDDAALRRIFDAQYPSILKALAKMPAAPRLSSEALARADRMAAALEFAEEMRRAAKMEAVGNLLNPVAYFSRWREATALAPFLRNFSRAYFRTGANEAAIASDRTAGFWSPQGGGGSGGGKRGPMPFDFAAPDSPMARRGLFLSSQDYRMWSAQLNTSKRMLEELQEIRDAVTHGLKVDWED